MPWISWETADTGITLTDHEESNTKCQHSTSLQTDRNLYFNINETRPQTPCKILIYETSQARPATRSFTPPPTSKELCPSAAGVIFSFSEHWLLSVALLLDSFPDFPESLSPASVSTPRNPNTRRCPSGRSCKLGARGRWWPRARPPIQGNSQRIMR